MTTAEVAEWLAQAERSVRAARMALSEAVHNARKGDSDDVAAGRACPTCRSDLTAHNRNVWNSGYSVGLRHAAEGSPDSHEWLGTDR